MKYCPEPGCSAKVLRGRCAEHERSRERGRRERRGPRPYDRRAWKRLRARKLAADPWCQMRTLCVRAEATEVHHVDGDGWNLAWANLQSACKPCHSAHTAREQSGFTDRAAANEKRISFRPHRSTTAPKAKNRANDSWFGSS